MIARPPSASRRKFNKSTNQINVLCKCLNSKELVKRLNSSDSQNIAKISDLEPSSVQMNDEIVVTANIQMQDDALLDCDVTLVAWSCKDEAHYFNLGKFSMDLSKYETKTTEG